MTYFLYIPIFIRDAMTDPSTSPKKRPTWKTWRHLYKNFGNKTNPFTDVNYSDLSVAGLAETKKNVFCVLRLDSDLDH